MKKYILPLLLVSYASGHDSVTDDLNRAISSGNISYLQNFNLTQSKLSKEQRKELLKNARLNSNAAQSSLYKRFELSDIGRFTFGACVGVIGLGMGKIGYMFFAENDDTPSRLIGLAVLSSGGILSGLSALEIYKSLTKYDRTQKHIRALAIESLVRQIKSQ